MNETMTKHSQLLETVKKNNIKSNFNKIQYKQKEVEYFGDTCTTQGHKPTDMKVEAITEMPKANMSERPTDFPSYGTISEQILS